MILFLLTYLGGVLTIVSPCILPVLPFVFARADCPFLRSGLPMLVGMAVTFAVVATLAAVAGGWAVEANQYGRAAALALLTLFGLTLLFPGLADRITQPLVALGARLSRSVEPGAGTRVRQCCSRSCSAWRRDCCGPCAGRCLGLILTGGPFRAQASRPRCYCLPAAGAVTSPRRHSSSADGCSPQ
jgi:cytochrome c biogenesis protein CcdA